MAWVQPPPEIQRKVAGVLGDRIWTDLEASFAKVLLVDPQMRATQWYRNPQEILCEKYGGAYCPNPKQLPNPRAALYTQHGVGLAVDVTPTEANRALVIRTAQRAGFYVGTYRSSRQLHISALTPQQWASSPLQAYLRAIVQQQIARRD